MSRTDQFGCGPWTLTHKLLKRPLTGDFDQTRLQCWPSISAARAELIIAKAICCVLTVATGFIANALQVLG